MKLTRRQDSKHGGMAQVGSSAVSAVAVIALIGVLLLMFGQRADRVENIDAVAAGTQRAVPMQETSVGMPPIPVAPSPEDHMGAEPGPIVPRGSVQAEPGTAEAKAHTPVDYHGSFTDNEIANAPRGNVVLFNQTFDQYKANGLRDALNAGGWKVTAVDRWNGAVQATTVYYPVGMELEARALMAAFPSIGRIKPAFAGIPSDKLTVIICKDLPTLR